MNTDTFSDISGSLLADDAAWPARPLRRASETGIPAPTRPQLRTVSGRTARVVGACGRLPCAGPPRRVTRMRAPDRPMTEPEFDHERRGCPAHRCRRTPSETKRCTIACGRIESCSCAMRASRPPSAGTRSSSASCRLPAGWPAGTPIPASRWRTWSRSPRSVSSKPSTGTTSSAASRSRATRFPRSWARSGAISATERGRRASRAASRTWPSLCSPRAPSSRLGSGAP
jgi:hypothetical protein